MSLADHTPILGWLIDGLRYIISLMYHADSDTVSGVTSGLNGFNTIIDRWVDENAPMTPDQCDRLIDLATRLTEIAEHRQLLHQAKLRDELLRLLWVSEKADRKVNLSSRQNSLNHLKLLLGLSPDTTPPSKPS